MATGNDGGRHPSPFAGVSILVAVIPVGVVRQRLNVALAAILANGTYARINRRYFLFRIFEWRWGM